MSGPQVEELLARFNEIDADGDGYIASKEIGAVLQAAGEFVGGHKIRQLIASIDANKDGRIGKDEFIASFANMDAKGGLRDKLLPTRGDDSGGESTTYSYSDSEQRSFIDWINTSLKNDPDCVVYLPLNPNNSDLYQRTQDGIIYCKMINLSVAETVDERAINKTNLNVYRRNENLSLAINSARAIGCTTANTGIENLMEGKTHHILGLIWQIIRVGLFRHINLAQHSGIILLLEEGETQEDLSKLSPEELLLRWVNYHLRNSCSNRRIKNFSSDIADCEVYGHLISQITPDAIGTSALAQQLVEQGNFSRRAELMLKEAERIGCCRFVSSRDIISGNSKLNLAFVANLFNNYPALEKQDGDFKGNTREEGTYRNWINSLGVDPIVYHLFNDLSNGLIIFQVYESMQKGIVNWDKVNKAPFKVASGGTMKRNSFTIRLESPNYYKGVVDSELKSLINTLGVWGEAPPDNIWFSSYEMGLKIENCNYAVELGKRNKFSLLGIEGKDIYDGNPASTLAYVRQLMKAHSLKDLNRSENPIMDQDIIKWANQKLSSAGKKTKLDSFKDPSIADVKIVIDLIDAIVPGSILYELVRDTDNGEDRLVNAKYAISMGRKIGAGTYALPDDIVEVKEDMVFDVFSRLMATDMDRSKA